LATQEVTDNFEEFRREVWKHVKESKTMKDTDYFIVIDVVTPGYPVWIIYNPDREEDSEDPTAADLLQSTSKFPQLDSKSGFGAARILTGIRDWMGSYARPSPRLWPSPQLWAYPHLWPGPQLWPIPQLWANPHRPGLHFWLWFKLIIQNLTTIDEIKANISRTRIPYPVVGRLENMKIAEQMLFKAQGN
jgi:hypothetical protein